MSLLYACKLQLSIRSRDFRFIRRLRRQALRDHQIKLLFLCSKSFLELQLPRPSIVFFTNCSSFFASIVLRFHWSCASCDHCLRPSCLPAVLRWSICLEMFNVGLQLSWIFEATILPANLQMKNSSFLQNTLDSNGLRSVFFCSSPTKPVDRFSSSWGGNRSSSR